VLPAVTIWVLFFMHILFMVNRTFIATKTTWLTQYKFKERFL